MRIGRKRAGTSGRRQSSRNRHPRNLRKRPRLNRPARIPAQGNKERNVQGGGAFLPAGIYGRRYAE